MESRPDLRHAEEGHQPPGLLRPRRAIPGAQPFAVQCTSIANLDRVAQNRKFDAITDKAAKTAALEAAEKDGTRVKPEFGSVWLTMNGPDKEHARIHTTIAVPGATTQSMGLPSDNNSRAACGS